MASDVERPVPVRGAFLPYAIPCLGEEEIAEVADSLRSGWITTGPKVKRFEEAFSRYIGGEYALAVNSCTAGLHLALAALGVGPGDEVILPTLTFCATANVVVHIGARPVLVDVGEDFNVTATAIEAAITPRTKAIMPVHYGGQACDLGDIYTVAARHQLAVVEDAAHAVGSTYRGLRIGSRALALDFEGLRRVTVFSFYATKNLTTGEGGMIVTDDEALADRMRVLTLHGMSRDAWQRYTSAGSWQYDVVAAGYKYNMTDVQAAIGLHQLAKLETFIQTRRTLARKYDARLGDIAEVETPATAPDRDHTYHLYAVKLRPERLAISRDAFVDELRRCNIGTSVHFIPVHVHTYYRDRFGYSPADFPVAFSLYQRIVSLPLYPGMTPADVECVSDIIQWIVATHRT